MEELISAKFGFPEEDLRKIIRAGIFLPPRYKRGGKDRIVGEMTDEEKAANTYCLQSAEQVDKMTVELGLLATSSLHEDFKKSKLMHDISVLDGKINMVKYGMLLSVATRFISADKCVLAICSDFSIVVPDDPRNYDISIGLAVDTPLGEIFIGTAPEDVGAVPEDATFH